MLSYHYLLSHPDEIAFIQGDLDDECFCICYEEASIAASELVGHNSHEWDGLQERFLETYVANLESAYASLVP